MKKFLLGLLTFCVVVVGVSIFYNEKLGQANDTCEEIATNNIQMIEENSETETEAEPEPEVKTITITATGDCTLGNNHVHSYDGSFNSYYDANGQDYFFQNVRTVFEQDDFTLVNLECVLSDSNARVDKQFNLKGRPEYVGILTGSSVEACSLGNNHTLDYGEQGLNDTIFSLQQAGLVFGYNDSVGVYTADNGIRIGIVSASLLSKGADREAYIKNGIDNLKSQNVDLIIVSCHWGEEGVHNANSYQITMGHNIIDWGADLVIGNHPHVLQGIEEYNGKIICYSLGNFCFGGNKNPKDKNSMMYQQTFTFIDGNLQTETESRIIPCMVSSSGSYNDYQPTIVTGEKKQSIINLVSSYSEGLGNVTFDEDGRIIH